MARVYPLNISFILFFLFLLPISSLSSPFEFVRDLQGRRKGDKVKDIYNLKKYMLQFGYLSSDGLFKNQNSADNEDDFFDDLLEGAIKTYQTNYHLKATGHLDSGTVAEMVKPRCGVADIVNGTNWMQSGKKRHHHIHGPLHTVAHFSFFPGSPRWPPSKTSLTYAFHPGTPSEAVRAVSQAFGQWASSTHFTFAQTQDRSSADMSIAFHRRDHGDGSPFDGPGGTIAHAFAPTDGRFHYDADERYAVGPVPGAFDYETIALHQIGHLLGLGHSQVREAIMFASISDGVTKGLHSDDIDGIQALYGASATHGCTTFEIL